MMHLRANFMREKGIEPSSPCGAPDPKTGTDHEYSPLQGLPGNRSRTAPHETAPTSTGDVTAHVTRAKDRAENTNRSDASSVALPLRSESLPTHYRGILRVLRELHGNADVPISLPCHLRIAHRWAR